MGWVIVVWVWLAWFVDEWFLLLGMIDLFELVGDRYIKNRMSGQIKAMEGHLTKNHPQEDRLVDERR